ncbi:MAG: AmmeMemoRadiSam system protein B [Planctomycetia bacterium]|nr:AmmeMemoRadiSam system protein B [Planctomycetia bacterium]
MERPSLRNLVLSPYSPLLPEDAENDAEKQPNSFVLEDPEGFAPTIVVPVPLAILISLMDGKRTCAEIVSAFTETTGENLTLSDLEEILKHFESLHFLDSPTFAAWLKEEMDTFQSLDTRPAVNGGQAYEKDAAALDAQIAATLEIPVTLARADGEGKTPEDAFPKNLVAAVVPHIDLGRGAASYGWAYRAILERCSADTFVIFGTSHNPMKETFALSTKHFETPLGVLETDRALVAKIVSHFQEKYAGKEPVDLFADEFVHRDEHSIEFQTIFLKYMENHTGRKIRIVPILTNTFVPFIGGDADPADDPAVRALLDSVAAVLDESGSRKIAILASAEFSQVGPMFGTPTPVDEKEADRIREDDTLLLFSILHRDPAGFWDTASRKNNANNLCGTAPIYCLLELLAKTHLLSHDSDKPAGELVSYEQTIDDPTRSCVSFATVLF